MTTETPGPVEGGGPSIGPAFLFIVGAALASAFVAIWGVQVIGQQHAQRLAARVDSLRTVLEQERVAAGRGGDAGTGAELVAPEELDALRRAGLRDPIAELKADLAKHPELIPLPATAGGKMAFYSEQEMRLVGAHWVFARFEDGHVGGSGLFEYEVRDGRIRWKRVAGARD
jgi:hypothetical protein